MWNFVKIQRGRDIFGNHENSEYRLVWTNHWFSLNLWSAFHLLLITLFLIGCQTDSNNKDPVKSPTQVPIFPDKSIETQIPTFTFPSPVEITKTKPVTVIATKETLTPVETFVLCSPLAEHKIEDLKGIISSPYDPPSYGKDDRHHGVDFAYYNQAGRKSIEGEGVNSILSGVVVAVVENRLPYGNMIMIETPLAKFPTNLLLELGSNSGKSIYHLYAHLEKPPIADLGDRIDCGDLLGVVGKTGYNVPIAHLHFETRIGPAGSIFHMMSYYDTQANNTERENYELWRMSGTFRHFDPMILFAKPWQMYWKRN